MARTELPGGRARLALGLIANEEGRLDYLEVALRLPSLDPACKGFSLEQLAPVAGADLRALEEAGLVEEAGGLYHATVEAKRLLYDAGELRRLPTIHDKACPFCGSRAVAYQGMFHGVGVAAPSRTSHNLYACLSCGRHFHLYSEVEHQ